ncbi:MAG: hypothetical protein ACR2OE_03785 [Thermomicrobiales bacterium]
MPHTRNPPTGTSLTPNASLHYRYWIGILVAVAVGFAALAFAKVPGVGSYLSFALTVGSLLLSALAIVYAFLSNASNAESLGALKGRPTTS